MVSHQSSWHLFERFIVFSLFLLFSVTNSSRISLTGDDWLISNDNQSLQATGTVPGTIHTILFSAKLIDDPYWRFGDTNLRYLIYESWTFTKRFSLQGDFLNLTQFILHFDQIDTVSNITLNECYLGNTTSMFFTYTFNVRSNCLRNDNILRIQFMSPVLYALDQSIAYIKPVHPNCTNPIQHGECHAQFIRKEPCSFSWDWSPTFAPIGIPGNVYVEGINSSISPLQLDSVNVVSQSGITKAWQVEVQLSGGNNASEYTFAFQLKNTTWSFNVNITLNERSTITLSIPNEDVQLWWPNGHGDQSLYELIVSNNNQQIGSRLIGFRSVELVQDNYSTGINGTSFYFRINSQVIFIKGSNWLPPDSFQERVSDEKMDQLLLSAQLAGINMLRIWGGGIYERDHFYETADRLGIMLWQDFMFSDSFYPADDTFLLNVRNEVRYQVQRLQSHPSLVLWVGNNENEMGLASYIRSLTPEEQERYKDEYRKLYIDTIMATVNEIDPHSSRPFLPSSPSNGIESAQENYTSLYPNSRIYGDVHFYNDDLDPWDSDIYTIPRFLSETGIQSMPSFHTWQQATNLSEDFNFNSTLLQNRQHHPDGQKRLLLEAQRNLPFPITSDPLKNFTQLIYLTQINQAMTLKTINDHCRYYSPIEMINPNTSQGNTMGFMYWQLNDIWEAPTWSTIEYGLKWKMAHYYVRHMFSPIYIFMRLTPYLPSVSNDTAEISLYFVNDLVDITHNQVNCSIQSFDTFQIRLSLTYDVVADSIGVKLIANQSYKLLMEESRCLNSSECVMLCSLNSNGQQMNENQTLFFSRPKDIQLYKPNLRVTSIEQQSATEINLTINAEKPALFVWLDVPNGMNGYFSRNGFHIFQEEITVTFTSWTSLTNFDQTNLDFYITSLYDVTQP